MAKHSVTFVGGHDPSDAVLAKAPAIAYESAGRLADLRLDRGTSRTAHAGTQTGPFDVLRL